MGGGGGRLQYVFSGEMLSDSPNLALLGWGGGEGGREIHLTSKSQIID